MKSKIISTALCICAMIATFWLIQIFPTEMPKKTEEEAETSEPSVQIPTPDSVSRSFVIETAHDAEDLMTTLAYGSSKSYDTELRDLILRLNLSSDYLKDTLQDYPGAGYFAKVADILEEIIASPFTDSASFSTRVSKMIYELENLYPAEAAAALDENHPENPMYYPKFDTEINGTTTLAMLAIFRQQYQKNTGSILLTVGGNLYTGDTLLEVDEAGSFKNRAANSKYSFPLHKVSSVLGTDTISFANLETPLTNSIGNSTAAGSLKGLPEYAKALKNGGLDIVSVANPGVLSFGDSGKADTLKALNEASLSFSDEASVCYYKTDLGIVAYISYDIIDEIGSNVNLLTWDATINDIPAAKAKGAKFVVVHFNWVNTYQKPSDPSSSQVKIAQQAVDNGAHLVIGSHPDLAEGLIQYNGVNIVFSAGNLYKKSDSETPAFLFQQAFTLDTSGNPVPGEVLLIPIVGGSGSSPTPSVALDSATTKSLQNNLLTWSRGLRYGIGKKPAFGIEHLNMITITK